MSTHWRSLPEHHQVRRESGTSAIPAPLGLDRREFLHLVEAALASAGLAGCTLKPPENALPYVVAPEALVAGGTSRYATTVPFAGFGIGVLGTCVSGRPIKLEGHPEHPASLGAANVFVQSEILSLYDPDRSRFLVHGNDTYSWAEFLRSAREHLAALTRTHGRGLRLLAGTITSPTVTEQLDKMLAAFPEARIVRFEPVDDDAARSGMAEVYGRPLHAVPRLAPAKRLLLWDADTLYGSPGGIRHARDFADGRNGSPATMSRLYAVEPTPSVTGGNADHRLPIRASRIEAYARVAARYLAGNAEGEDGLPAEHRLWLKAAVDDLKAHRGAALVLAGPTQPPAVHALAHWMTWALGGVGKVIDYVEPFDATLRPNSQDLGTLTSDMLNGKVEVLIMLGVNPVYAGPCDVPFASALARVPMSIHHGLYRDETAERCNWHVPEAHPLESWGDLCAYDGTVSLQQPLIRALYGGKTAAELLSALLDSAPADGLALVRQHWSPKRSPGGASDGAADTAWFRLVESSLVSAAPPIPVVARPLPDVGERLVRARSPAPLGGGLELAFRPDPCVWDGRYANSAWLQEMPKPYLTLTWDNAVLLSPADARHLGVGMGEHLRLATPGAEVTAPALVLPGQAEGVATLALGYGRRAGGALAAQRGVSAYILRDVGNPWIVQGLAAARTTGYTKLALTQTHHTMEGRDLARSVTAADLATSPAAVLAKMNADAPSPDQTLYPPMPTGDYAWGMSIDLSRCIGCNACTAACQAENNIPSVGKEQVLAGREMHWIRVDRYFEGDPAAPLVHYQPVPCMHCEKAPCEVVCPVGATLHNAEGLNEMVYNRCVGTRYCSNNCPYKVRRFNFFPYAEPRAPVAELVYNPDVSVREHGVMEKCTYCVQRINGARILAEREDRRIRDGEVVPACAAACPTQAINFGDVADKTTLVSRIKADVRNYSLLAELNTRPRTTYLARVRNHNPVLPEGLA